MSQSLIFKLDMGIDEVLNDWFMGLLISRRLVNRVESTLR